MFFGVGLLILVFLLPGGFVAGMRKLRARIVQVVPHPSWLADVAADTGHDVEITEAADVPEANLLSS